MTAASGDVLEAEKAPRGHAASVALAGAFALVGGLVGFAFGQSHPRIHEEVTSCLSAVGTISCELEDGWTVAVPKDVHWEDRNGAFHSDGRPRCLPPSGIGLEGPVRLGIVPVEMGGMGWRQVVWVACP
ncbi:MAG TPA: hypothetical protein VFR87_02410 [Nocardioidaceae bacterium]|nr:hypothetical protein [Nocardioidaceae bacterium]